MVADPESGQYQGRVIGRMTAGYRLELGETLKLASFGYFVVRNRGHG